MMKIQRTANGEIVLIVSGRLDETNIGELKREIMAEPEDCCLVLDLTELTHVDRAAVRFLRQGEGDGIKLENCPAYIREWMAHERDERN